MNLRHGWLCGFCTAVFLAVGAAEAQSFPNGIAAGDVTQDSAILWARTTALGDLTFEYSTSPDFTSGVLSIDTVSFDPNIPVKVPVSGLSAGTRYYYRVTSDTGEQLIGQFRTPAPAGTYGGLRFGVGGDVRGDQAPHPAIKNVPERDLDFYVGLGDTANADFNTPVGGQATTLAQYRAKHAEVYGERFGENFWDDLRSSTAIFATIDDHEVFNDFAGGATVDTNPAFNGPPGTFINDSDRYEAAMTAFQEYNPIADEFYGSTGDPVTSNERKLYRYRRFGNDAALFMLDARSFRDQPLDDAADPFDTAQVNAFLAASFDPSRTLLGEAQLQGLKNDLLSAHQEGVMWKFVVIPEPIQHFGMLAAADRAEGYMAERTEILKFIDDNHIDHVVFISADFHGSLVNNLTYQESYAGPQISTNAIDVITSAVAHTPPLGIVMLQIAEQVEVEPGVTLRDVLFEHIEDETGNPVPGLGAFNNLPLQVRNDAIEWLSNEYFITPLGYSPIGLEDSGLEVQIITGGYTSTFNYGWTEFEIDPDSRALTVTMYGIEPYTVAALNNNPQAVIASEPVIVSRFVISDPIPEPGVGWMMLAAMGAAGRALAGRGRVDPRIAPPRAD